QEPSLDPELHSWLAFARQKLQELRILADVLDVLDERSDEHVLQPHRAARESRQQSTRVHRPEVARRQAALDADATRRLRAHAERAQLQQAHLQLPLYPTTTIGSFPQTPEVRQARARLLSGK